MDREKELFKWLKFIAAANSEERIKVADGDEVMLEFNDWIDNFIHSEEYKNIVKTRYADDIKHFLKEGASVQDICHYTGLSEDEVEKFIAEL